MITHYCRGLSDGIAAMSAWGIEGFKRFKVRRCGTLRI
jgi:hypothetical protein